MSKFKPTKAILAILDRRDKATEAAEDMIKARIAKLCKKKGLRYSCFLSWYATEAGDEVENDATKKNSEYIDWFEREFHCVFDPQSICDQGVWC